MSTYEEQRQARIKQNQALLDELGIENKRPAPSSRPPPLKKRKTNTVPVPPSRVSARIASAPKPSYNEDTTLSLPASTRARKSTTTSRTQAPQSLPSPSPEPALDAESIQQSWTTWTPTGPAPTRDPDGTFHFPDWPVFTPNKSPLEVLSEGAFGGTYYHPLRSRALGITVRDDHESDLPSDWIAALNVEKQLTRDEYEPETNKYGVRCGQSIEEWEAAGWIRAEFDVRGWFQWYIRFFRGRRCEDDERQVGRWSRCVGERGRWRRTLLKRYLQAGVRSVADEGGDEEEVSPVLHQTCLHWAWEIRQEVLDEVWKNGL